MPDQFDWEQEGYKRLRHLEGVNADLRRENAFLREQLREKEWETAHSTACSGRAQAAVDGACTRDSTAAAESAGLRAV